MAGKKTGAADKGPRYWIIKNGKYSLFLTGIVKNEKDGVIYTYATGNPRKAKRFTEAEAKETAAKCRGRLCRLPDYPDREARADGEND